MAKVIITDDLLKQISKKFDKNEADSIIDLMETLESNPSKGKELCCINNLLIKELKYKKFRFYFFVDGYKIKFLSAEDLKDLIIKFVRMSDKKDQEAVIDEIRTILRNLGDEGF